MNSESVIAVFSKSGGSPRKGARITKLLLVVVEATGREAARIQLPRQSEKGELGIGLHSEFFDEMLRFIGDRTPIVPDRYDFARFIRAECPPQQTKHVKALLARTFDLSDWSRQRFPGMRKDLKSLCKRLQIRTPKNLEELEGQAEAIRLMIPKLRIGSEKPLRPLAAFPVTDAGKPAEADRSILQRLRSAWNALVA